MKIMRYSRIWLTMCMALASSQAMAQSPSMPERGWAHSTGLISLGRSMPVDRASIADRIAIQEAFSRWGIAWDEGRIALIEDMFTADGHFKVVKASATPIVSVSGRERIKANVAYGLAQQHEQRRHIITNVVIDSLDRHSASAIAYSVVITHSGAPAVDGTVVYSAKLVRGRDRIWRFESLTIGLDSYGGEPPRPLPSDAR